MNIRANPAPASAPSARHVAAVTMAAESLNLPREIAVATAETAEDLKAAQAYLADLDAAFSRAKLDRSKLNVQAAAEAIRGGATARDVAIDMVAEASGSRESGYAPRATVGHSWDRGPGFVARLADGVRAQIDRRHKPEIGREFAHAAPSDIAEACLMAAGERFIGSRADAISMAITHSQSDFPAVYENALHNALVAQYQAGEPEIMRAYKSIPAPDFRPRSMIRFSAAAEPPPVNENGEIKHVSPLEEGEFAPLAKGHAAAIVVSFEMLVNDDHGALDRLPVDQARGVQSLVRKHLVQPLVGPAGAGQLLKDGNPLFHSSRGNVAGSGGALSVSTLSAGMIAMRRQKGLHDELIDIRPRFLLVAPEQEPLALQMMAAISADSPDNANIFAGRFEVLVDPALEAGRWYLIADPMQAESLIFSWLDGYEGPRLRRTENWRQRGMTFVVEADFGAAAIDGRPVYMNPGS